MVMPMNLHHDLFKDEIPDGYAMAAFCYAGYERSDAFEFRERWLKAYPTAKFEGLVWDEIHGYRFFTWLPEADVSGSAVFMDLDGSAYGID